MQRLSWPQFREAMVMVNRMYMPTRVGYIVFEAEHLDRLDDERSRIYRVDSNATEFDTRTKSHTLYGRCLDGSSQRRVELLKRISGGWKIAYCVLLDPGEPEWYIGPMTTG